MVARHSRPEAFSKVQTTLADEAGKKASIIDTADYQDTKGGLKLRGIEGGDGIQIHVLDADDNVYDGMDPDKAQETKIVISVSGGLSDDLHDTDLLVYNAAISATGDTVFPIPVLAFAVHTVTINGLETTNWSFTLGPPTIFFNETAEGYSVDPDDELLIFYKATTP